MVFEGLLRIADDNLILGHRTSEWCGHAPTLEEDLALPNIALDLIGHAQTLYCLACEIDSRYKNEILSLFHTPSSTRFVRVQLSLERYLEVQDLLRAWGHVHTTLMFYGLILNCHQLFSADLQKPYRPYYFSLHVTYIIWNIIKSGMAINFIIRAKSFFFLIRIRRYYVDRSYYPN